MREATVQRVLGVVRRLGYVRDTHAANLARQRQYRFLFMLPAGAGEFVARIEAAVAEAAGAQVFDRVSVDVRLLPSGDSDAVTAAIQALDPALLDGVVLMVQETPRVRDAAARLRERGIHVVALVSDLPARARDYFIGINNIQAGRTAATLMGRFLGDRRGEIMVVTNSLRAHESHDRRLGFDQIMVERYPRLDVLPSLESRDDPELLAEVVTRALDRHPDIVGVYAMGGGNRMLLDTLAAAGRADGLVVIAHELTDSTRAGLLNGQVDVVITQDVGHLVRSALRVLRALSDSAPIYDAQERVRIEIVIRENLPE
ncbi:MAG: LacI family DNA-binding transcriptional regulator [Roseovarius sp.]